VREAVRVLEAQGVLRSQPGAGATAGTFVAALPRDALTRFLRLHVALSNFTIQDVTDARVVLERASAASASRRHDDTARSRMVEALDRMDQPHSSRDSFNEADTQFHLAIAEASGSALSAALTAAIRSAMKVPILRAAERTEEWPDEAQRLRREHRAIYAAIDEEIRPAPPTSPKRTSVARHPYCSASSRQTVAHEGQPPAPATPSRRPGRSLRRRARTRWNTSAVGRDDGSREVIAVSIDLHPWPSPPGTSGCRVSRARIVGAG
jgi:DNA-binding GntR family transcriptional regulator